MSTSTNFWPRNGTRRQRLPGRDDHARWPPHPRPRRDHLWQQFYISPGATHLDGPPSLLANLQFSISKRSQRTATAGGYRLMTRLPRAVTACGNRVPGRGPARVGYTLTARAARKRLWSRAVTAYRGPPPRGRRSNRGESSRGPRLADAVTRGRFTRLPRRPRAVTARGYRVQEAVTAPPPRGNR